MNALWIWGTAAVLYVLFRAWYDNWRGPLTGAEIDSFLDGLEKSPGEGNDAATLRTFLEADDGRDFVMLNLVRLDPNPVRDPGTGEMTDARGLLRRYLRGFIPVLLRRGGHPAMHATKIGGYVDAWNVPPDPGWTMVGWVRYRSRRDMMLLATDPRFQNAHPFKAAAMPVTFSFPTAPGPGLLLGPRVWVALVLALLAALANLALA